MGLKDFLENQKDNTVNKNKINTLVFGFTFEKQLEIAQNPKTSSETLKQLAENNDWEIRKAVAANENTDLSVLKKLFEDIKKETHSNWDIRCTLEEIANNPNADSSLLHKIAIYENNKAHDSHYDTMVICKIIKHDNVDYKTIKMLLNNPDITDELQERLLQYPKTKPEFLKILVDINKNFLHGPEYSINPEYSIKAENRIKKIINHPQVNNNVLKDIMDATGFSDLYIQLEIAKTQTNNPVALLYLLSKNSQDIIYETIAQDSSVDSTVLFELITKTYRVYPHASLLALHNPNMDAKTLNDIIVKKDEFGFDNKQYAGWDPRFDEIWDYREEVAKHPNANPDILDILANTKEDLVGFGREAWKVRYTVAQNENTRMETLFRLSTDDNKQVREQAEIIINRRYAKSHEIDSYVLDVMIRDTKDEQTKINIVQNLNTDPASLRWLMKNDPEFYQNHKDDFPKGFDIKAKETNDSVDEKDIDPSDT
jgi:hypothetical protein